jgi:uncharacterized lipoprotein YbaY
MMLLMMLLLLRATAGAAVARRRRLCAGRLAERRAPWPLTVTTLSRIQTPDSQGDVSSRARIERRPAARRVRS